MLHEFVMISLHKKFIEYNFYRKSLVTFHYYFFRNKKNIIIFFPLRNVFNYSGIFLLKNLYKFNSEMLWKRSRVRSHKIMINTEICHGTIKWLKWTENFARKHMNMNNLKQYHGYLKRLKIRIENKVKQQNEVINNFRY